MFQRENRLQHWEFHSAPDQLIPMEHEQTRRPAAFLEAADITDNSAQKIRAHLNRKRQHESTEIGNERFQTENRHDGNQTGKEGGLTSSHVMEETGEFQHDDNMMPSHTMKSPAPPLSPFTPFVPAPRGVLKHSISQDSQSTETLTKRRRVEEDRRVRFSEEVVIIEPPEPGPDASDSEEDSGAEEDSVTDQECEEEPAAAEEEAPARRHALPAWILALKRNSGRKHR
ncbi:hypothetical protein OYC64_013140 [Pagothenia borchgrevinki]|uniref:Uncharacterized protein n=1 Tax=Pagothenia borchgrevinki TaxID=8213 RepID=A0ABD2FTB4_PAGBO